ncbi:MAG: DUF2975 domain-containing protein [Clostridia bacterium]|nr:DUF2975 domain-containing protein [Clostridia bacterium]
MLARKISLSISIVLTVLLFLALIPLTVVLPNVVRQLIGIADQLGFCSTPSALAQGWILADAYAMVAVAFVALILLLLLLWTVRRGEVFSRKATQLLAAIAWCCFAECLLFSLLTGYFTLSLGVAFGVLLVGLCLRVVMHALEEATRIKAENDFTI